MIALESDSVGEKRAARRARRERERDGKVASSPEARAKDKTDKAKRAAADARSGMKKRKKADKAAASPEVASDAGAQPKTAALELYLKNPEQQPSSRSPHTPVPSINQLLLGDHGLLIDEKNDVDCQETLLTAVGGAIFNTLISTDFRKKFCIDQLSKEELFEAPAEISEAFINNTAGNLRVAANLIHDHDSGKLLTKEKHEQLMHEATQEKVSLLADLKVAQAKIGKQNQAAVKSLSNALGAIYDEIEAMTSPSSGQVLKLINEKRQQLEPDGGLAIDYKNLKSAEKLSDLTATQTKAMDSSLNQKYFDKYKKDINGMTDDSASEKLESLHQKLLSTGVKYDPEDADEFPSKKSAFKSKFGLHKKEFWMMKALEKKLGVLSSPGAVLKATEQATNALAHFSAISPSPVKRLDFSEKSAVNSDAGRDSSPGDGNSGEKNTTDIDMLDTKFDKSFDKAVDWSKPAVEKIMFSAGEGDDIVQFFCDFEEVMSTRAPYTRFEELLGRLKEQSVASAVREYARSVVQDHPSTTIIELRKMRMARYDAAKKYLLDQFEDEERGSKLLKSFDNIKMASNNKYLENYTKYKMKLDKVRRQINVIDNELLSPAHFQRQFVAGLAPKLKQKLEEDEDSAALKKNEQQLNQKLLKWSRAMSKAAKASPTLATIAEANEVVESEVDLSTDEFKQLRAFLNKRKPSSLGGGNEKKQKKKDGKKDSNYVDVKDIQEKAFKHCYTQQEWKKRVQAREQNESYSKNPQLYCKDRLKGKPCCVKCRKVGHTANECRRGASHMQTIMKELQKSQNAEGKRELMALLKQLSGSE